MSEHYPFSVKPLPYSYDALEPYIDMATMYFHHDKHYATYVENLNKALHPYPQYHDWSLEKLLADLHELPEELQTPVKNQGGGVYNHELYFSIMTPSQTEPAGSLQTAIENSFGDFNTMLGTLLQTGSKVFGSGYSWLTSYDGGHLAILWSPNQDNPLTHNLYPLLLIDVWEHAYYLKHQNKRDDYLNDWAKVINWDKVEENFNQSAEYFKRKDI